MNKINTLQILRAFAALSVVVTHVFQKSTFKPFGSYFLSGQYGVDIFFILSGFLIYITTRNQSNPWDYLKKRLFRIFPAYWLALTCYTLCYLISNQISLNFKIVLQNVLMIPWDSRWKYDSLIVGVAWSTMFEMFFYILFFILISLRLKRKVILFLIPSLLLIFIPLSRSFPFLENVPFISLFVSIASSPFLIMFFIGSLIGNFYLTNKIPLINKSIYKYILIGSIVLMIITMLLMYNILLSALSATLLFMSVMQYERYFSLNFKNLAIAKSIWLGDISYSIYIFHVLIITIFKNVLFINYIPSLLVLTMITTIFVSKYSFNYIEKKFIELGRNQKRSLRTISLSLTDTTGA